MQVSDLLRIEAIHVFWDESIMITRESWATIPNQFWMYLEEDKSAGWIHQMFRDRNRQRLQNPSDLWS